MFPPLDDLVRSRWALAPGGTGQIMVVMTTMRIPVVFIHGLWLHATSWPWIGLFEEVGYDATAPGWPGIPDPFPKRAARPLVSPRPPGRAPISRDVSAARDASGATVATATCRCASRAWSGLASDSCQTNPIE
jgi:pimeloyl-ACP methyl ester carboxylesterase